MSLINAQFTHSGLKVSVSHWMVTNSLCS